MAECTRRFFIGGNWKMNGNKASIPGIIDTLKSNASVGNRDYVIGVPAIYMNHVRDALPENICVAAQNCYKVGKGAFTGETSADMIKDINCHWVILGHSERRHVFEESDQLVADKVEYALNAGLKVVYCIGETLEERESNNMDNVLSRQMQSVLAKIPSVKWVDVVLAYEPVWAIGTGKTASPQQAAAAHIMLRKWMKIKVSEDVAKSIRIIYGGSVTADNCAELAKLPDIDGFLVGGASLKPDFGKIMTVPRSV